MRRAAKVDANQKEIVGALRSAGFFVQSLAAVGQGFPDLLFAKAGRIWLSECKDGTKKPSARRLTPDQSIFFDKFPAHIYIFKDLDDVELAIEQINSKLNTKRVEI